MVSPEDKSQMKGLKVHKKKWESVFLLSQKEEKVICLTLGPLPGVPSFEDQTEFLGIDLETPCLSKDDRMMKLLIQVSEDEPPTSFWLFCRIEKGRDAKSVRMLLQLINQHLQGSFDDKFESYRKMLSYNSDCFLQGYKYMRKHQASQSLVVQEQVKYGQELTKLPDLISLIDDNPVFNKSANQSQSHSMRSQQSQAQSNVRLFDELIDDGLETSFDQLIKQRFNKCHQRQGCGRLKNAKMKDEYGVPISGPPLTFWDYIPNNESEIPHHMLQPQKFERFLHTFIKLENTCNRLEGKPTRPDPTLSEMTRTKRASEYNVIKRAMVQKIKVLSAVTKAKAKAAKEEKKKKDLEAKEERQRLIEEEKKRLRMVKEAELKRQLESREHSEKAKRQKLMKYSAIQSCSQPLSKRDQGEKGQNLQIVLSDESNTEATPIDLTNRNNNPDGQTLERIHSKLEEILNNETKTQKAELRYKKNIHCELANLKAIVLEMRLLVLRREDEQKTYVAMQRQEILRYLPVNNLSHPAVPLLFASPVCQQVILEKVQSTLRATNNPKPDSVELARIVLDMCFSRYIQAHAYFAKEPPVKGNLGLSWDKVLLPREFVDFYLNIVVDTFEFTNVTKTNRPKVFQKSPVSVALTKVRTAYHMFVGGKETTMRDWMHARYKSKLRFANKHYDSKREGRELRVPTFEEEVKQYMKSGKAFKKVSDLKKPHGVRIVQEFPTPCGKPLSIQGIQDVIIRLFQAGYSRPPPINFSMAEIFMQKGQYQAAIEAMAHVAKETVQNDVIVQQKLSSKKQEETVTAEEQSQRMAKESLPDENTVDQLLQGKIGQQADNEIIDPTGNIAVEEDSLNDNFFTNSLDFIEEEEADN